MYTRTLHGSMWELLCDHYCCFPCINMLNSMDGVHAYYQYLVHGKTTQSKLPRFARGPTVSSLKQYTHHSNVAEPSDHALTTTTYRSKLRCSCTVHIGNHRHIHRKCKHGWPSAFSKRTRTRKQGSSISTSTHCTHPLPLRGQHILIIGLVLCTVFLMLAIAIHLSICAVLLCFVAATLSTRISCQPVMCLCGRLTWYTAVQ